MGGARGWAKGRGKWQRAALPVQQEREKKKGSNIKARTQPVASIRRGSMIMLTSSWGGGEIIEVWTRFQERIGTDILATLKVL
jgi:hypothetical protein